MDQKWSDADFELEQNLGQIRSRQGIFRCPRPESLESGLSRVFWNLGFFGIIKLIAIIYVN